MLLSWDVSSTPPNRILLTTLPHRKYEGKVDSRVPMLDIPTHAKASKTSKPYRFDCSQGLRQTTQPTMRSLFIHGQTLSIINRWNHICIPVQVIDRERMKHSLLYARYCSFVSDCYRFVLSNDNFSIRSRRKTHSFPNISGRMFSGNYLMRISSHHHSSVILQCLFAWSLLELLWWQNTFGVLCVILLPQNWFYWFGSDLPRLLISWSSRLWGQSYVRVRFPAIHCFVFDSELNIDSAPPRTSSVCSPSVQGF